MNKEFILTRTPTLWCRIVQQEASVFGRFNAKKLSEPMLDCT